MGAGRGTKQDERKGMKGNKKEVKGGRRQGPGPAEVAAFSVGVARSGSSSARGKFVKA